SVPGDCAAKYLGACPVTCQNRSRRRSPVTLTKVVLATQPAARQSRLSNAISAPSSRKATQTLCDSPDARLSTRNLTAYCVPTAHITAAATAVAINACEREGRRK